MHFCEYSSEADRYLVDYLGLSMYLGILPLGILYFSKRFCNYTRNATHRVYNICSPCQDSTLFCHLNMWNIAPQIELMFAFPSLLVRLCIFSYVYLLSDFLSCAYPIHTLHTFPSHFHLSLAFSYFLNCIFCHVAFLNCNLVKYMY